MNNCSLMFVILGTIFLLASSSLIMVWHVNTHTPESVTIKAPIEINHKVNIGKLIKEQQ